MSAAQLANLTGGSRKGVPNKVPAQVKEMVIEALGAAGGVSYLVKQASANPAAFMTLVGKVIPMQVGGDGENPITHVHKIELVGVVNG